MGASQSLEAEKQITPFLESQKKPPPLDSAPLQLFNSAMADFHNTSIRPSGRI